MCKIYALCYIYIAYEVRIVGLQSLGSQAVYIWGYHI